MNDRGRADHICSNVYQEFKGKKKTLTYLRHIKLYCMDRKNYRELYCNQYKNFTKKVIQQQKNIFQDYDYLLKYRAKSQQM